MRIPPPLIAMLTAFFMYFTPRHALFQGSLVLACALGIFAFAIAFDALWQFKSQQGNISPQQLTQSRLIQTGIYAKSRNPMYLSLLIALGAWGAYLGNGLGLLWLPVFILFLNHTQIQREERYLSEQFGDAYQAYCHKVRRWL